MTKPVAITDTKRPWRAAGPMLRELLRCPLCTTGEPKVIAYRKSTTRLECRGCGLRFSLSPLALANILRMRPETVLDALPAGEKFRYGAVAIMGGANSPEEFEPLILDMLRGIGSTIGAAVLTKPDATPEERARTVAYAFGHTTPTVEDD